MRPDSLLSLVQSLRERIGKHRSALSNNEMLTRYALVDPLLYELGWNTSDPAIVIPEDTSGLGRGRPDYVLQDNGQPAMVIEAKKLGSGLQNGARQAIDYAMDANRQARYFAITDGQHWEIYDTNRPASDMRAASFDIMAASPAEVCLQAMALWRPAVEQGSVMAAETPIVGLDSMEQADVEPVDSLIHEPEHLPQEQPAIRETPLTVTQSDETGQEWIPLSEPRSYTRTKPAEIIFPDGSMKCTDNSWAKLIAEVTRWLYANGYLNISDMPIQLPRATTRYLVSDKPIHPGGNDFLQPQEAGPLYIETNYNAPTLVGHTRHIITYVSQDPAQFKVRLSS